VPFDVPEYESAFRTFFGEAIHEIAVARDPLISKIPFEQSPGALGSVIQDQEGNDIDLAAGSISTEFSMSRNSAIQGDVEALLLLADSLSEDLAKGLAQSLFGSLNTITEATGNVIDAEGRPAAEVIIEALETIELGLTDDDELSLPAIYMNPSTIENLSPPTPEQEVRIEEIKKEKLEELLARRRHRRLY
jgi:hypothetical protein